MEKFYNKIFLGEWFYLSPSVMKGKKYGKEDDVWAVGILLIEMATFHNKPHYDPYDRKFGEPLLTAEQVTAGEHLKTVSQYSNDVRNIVDALLQVDEAKRVTMRDILHFPALSDEVNKLKKSADFLQQFAAV